VIQLDQELARATVAGEPLQMTDPAGTGRVDRDVRVGADLIGDGAVAVGDEDPFVVVAGLGQQAAMGRGEVLRIVRGRENAENRRHRG
jgi:hypothetical protein